MTIAKTLRSGVFFVELALARLDFVAAETLLGFSVGRVSSCDWVVLLKNDLLSCVHRVLSSVVRTVSSQLADETNQFALSILFCHINSLKFVKTILLILA